MLLSLLLAGSLILPSSAMASPAAKADEASKAKPPTVKDPPSKEELAAGRDTGVLIIKKDQKAKDKLVRVKTKDGWWIVFTYRPGRKGRPVAVLAHGYGSGRAEWAGLALELQAKGWGTVALDLRGHGDSNTGPAGRVDFNFIDSQGTWSDAVADLEAVLEHLRLQKVPLSRTCLVGASIGANLVSLAAARHPGLACSVLLSPGRDYRGVKLDENPFPKVRTLAAASPEDPYAYQTLVGFEARRSKIKLLEASRGHGVEMLRDADFNAELLRWLTRPAKP
ncbi:MAG: alpha/beta fold hydrolase [Elusimicrobia bacterium]|nr:alpha/beta fold hydrolase [Elusimicrobiota bacterium]